MIVKYTRAGGAEACAEAPLPGYSEKARAEADTSFLSVDGQNWMDISKDGINVCIKAFTRRESAGEQLVQASATASDGGMGSLAEKAEVLEGVTLDTSGAENLLAATKVQTEHAGSMEYADGMTVISEQANGALPTIMPAAVSDGEAPMQGLPSRYDLRESGAVSPVKHQLNSNCCWAFSACEAMQEFLLVHENVSHSFPLAVSIEGENEIVLGPDKPTAAYQARALLETEQPVSDTVSWEISGNLDSIQNPQKTGIAGEQQNLFEAAGVGKVTVTVSSAADETKTDSKLIRITDVRMLAENTPVKVEGVGEVNGLKIDGRTYDKTAVDEDFIIKAMNFLSPGEALQVILSEGQQVSQAVIDAAKNAGIYLVVNEEVKQQPEPKPEQQKPQKPQNTDKGQGKKAADTGDVTPLAGVLVCLALSAGVAGVILYRRSRRKG